MVIAHITDTTISFQQQQKLIIKSNMREKSMLDSQTMRARIVNYICIDTTHRAHRAQGTGFVFISINMNMIILLDHETGELVINPIFR